jgi:SAM-dependent methyltransferase
MPEALEAFLTAFPAHVAALVRSRAEQATTVIDDTARSFRLDPSAGLAALRARITPLVLSANDPGELVWCYSGDVSNGLDDFEMGAVLGRWVDIDLIHQSSAGPDKRVVIAGRLRHELVAIAFVATTGASPSQLRGFLAACDESQLPAILFISAAQLEGVLPGSELGAALDGHRRGGGGLGLLVPDAQTEDAFVNPAAQLEPFNRLGLAVRLVKFERGARLDPEQLDRYMRATGLTCDVSVPSAGASGSDLVRSGAYAGPSPYRPQPFDLRVPWFRTEPGMWIELPMFDVGDQFKGEFRDHLQWPGDEALAKRLDAHRMAAFYRASTISPELEPQYPEYRIYNWPRPAPANRVSLLNAGAATAERKNHVDRLLGGLTDVRLTIVNHDQLTEAAIAEVGGRYGLTTKAAIDVQHATHGYLGEISRYGPLRQDYADFARFAPADLGATLEIGSGYGVLAWALATRSSRYVCVDLEARMFRMLRADLGQSGVVADAQRMPFSDGAFDSIIANNVIEHLYDPLAGLCEIHRVLRPGGRLLALLPFDALENRHDLPAHLWKIDEPGLRRALSAAGFDIARLEVVNLHELGVSGAFPSCHGFVAMVDAQRPSAVRPSAVAPTIRPAIVRRTPQESERAGRSWPSVREQVRFEQWGGKHVVTVDADPDDVGEFTTFGAHVTEVSSATSAWDVIDGAADLVYTFLGVSGIQLEQLKCELLRVLKPTGIAVIAFRHRDGLRHLLRVRGHFGEVCDLDRLIGPASVAAVADGATGEDDYVSVDEVEAALEQVSRCAVTVNGLTREDFGAEFSRALPEEFWAWLNRSFGRFVIARVER